LKKQVTHLIELQKNDSEIKKVELRKEELPHELDQLMSELRHLEERVVDAKKRYDELMVNHAERENDLNNGAENIKRIKARLFEVKTNKEYQALLTEMDIIGEKNDAIEVGILHTLEMIDTVREEVETSEKEYVVIREDHEAKIRNVENEMNTIDSVLSGIRETNEQLREKIETSLLKKYEMIKQRRNGRAVVPVWKEVCSGCHMNIPPQMYNELQRVEELMQCPHCNRIIYWDDRSDEEQ